ncbi:MAG: D-alanyl-D-alanine carboxypeptidase/D-alanyl-D-alanine-endopeptidase [Planctomycetota bacterium]|nr:MAG: D-alanyl-D-alanine carboxypeptidase/D-alanyl-D-alanine-endopeptidase [Planctomycetota bacterium]
MTASKKTLCVIALLSINFSNFAKADLARRIDVIISQASQKQVQFGINIVKADTGKTIYSHNVKEAMVPASNMKIIVTAAALKYLGPNYAYKTRVGLCGNSLAVIGSGDPLLGDKVTDSKRRQEAGWIFEDITAKLLRNRQKTIKDIIVDSTIFDDERVHPNWPKKELNRWYACEVSGLNFNDNCIAISAKTIEDKTFITIEPETSYTEIVNKVAAIQKGKSAVGAYRNQKPNKIIVKGKCKQQVGPFDVAIERPAAFFGYLLAENLNKAGIKTDGRLLETSVGQDCDFKEIAEYTTPIADCLARCNKNSLQLAAEALLKTMAARATPDTKNGSWAKGRALIRQYLLELGIEEEEFYIDDGSGLSRQNKLSANAITTVLLDVYKGRNWQLYKNSLAIGGIDGTIAKYFKEDKYKGKVFGKTGYIDNVKSFSGICSTAKGDYVFSVLANMANNGTRAAINDVAKAIIDSE